MSVAPCFQKGFTFIALLMLTYPGDTGNIFHIFKIDNKAQTDKWLAQEHIKCDQVRFKL